AGIPGQINAIGSLSTVFFTPGPVRNYADAKLSDTRRYARFFREMLDRGISLAPSQFDAASASAALTSQDLNRTLAAAHVPLLAQLNKKTGEVLKDKYAKEVEHYDTDKVDVSKEAKNLEEERDLTVRKADRFDGGEALLEIGLVICSITLLTKRKGFWLGGLLIGTVGVALAATGFFLH